ncbi:hypothetical protein IWT25_02438 [Secundilactobacillus pentosiphilus]|uniref:Phage protein n=1 Tax=Secundilactobacillus pentosiphilus TaxID=1714682 RepID=A0A1Z5IZ19_9LACO|nr:hypothetical protein [Secundilactobacillus pentosiphilus]GAX07090.1 hypothetical protein IWT25_02438 [Secundilactobacillus pentosiphilus]
MKTNNQVIKELKAERDELWTRFSRLDHFIDTEEYGELPVHHQRLIQKQWDSMDDYYRALNSRIADLEGK